MSDLCGCEPEHSYYCATCFSNLTAENEKLKRIVEVYEKANSLYVDPENRKEEWVADTSYYDPNPPFRRTVLQHGKAARQAKEEVERIRKGENDE